MTQRDAILAALKRGEKLTKLDCLHRFGCTAPSSAINALRKAGHQIPHPTMCHENGHRFAVWEMPICEPEQASEPESARSEETPMSLTMKEKQAVTRQLAMEYKRATKKQKGSILDTLTELAGYNRSYAARVLRQRAKYVVVARGVARGVKVTLVEDERTKRKRTKDEWVDVKKAVAISGTTEGYLREVSYRLGWETKLALVNGHNRKYYKLRDIEKYAASRREQMQPLRQSKGHITAKLVKWANGLKRWPSDKAIEERVTDIYRKPDIESILDTRVFRKVKGKYLKPLRYPAMRRDNTLHSTWHETR